MSLTRTITKQRLTLLGLNSGTSADGIDMAVVRVQRKKHGVRVKYVEGHGRIFSRQLRDLVLKTTDATAVKIEALIRLDGLLGEFFGRAARSLCRRLEQQGVKIDVIASHGQTVRHQPDKVRVLGQLVHGTMQLGSLERIAALTGRPTVGDFRQADVAAGGEGAPITTGAMQRLFGVENESRLIVNVGGMANYFYFPARGSAAKISAADCGPGNSLCDILSTRLSGRRYDKGGRLAKSGRVDDELLEILSADRFFTRPTDSTGRERFGAALADQIITFGERRRLNDADLMRTAAELTVRSIAAKIRPLVRRDRKLTKLYLTGGGRRNIFFVKRLEQLLPELVVCMIDELGSDGDFVEAAAFAVMGEACLRGEPLASARRRGRPVPGKIVQPPLPKKPVNAKRRRA